MICLVWPAAAYASNRKYLLLCFEACLNDCPWSYAGQLAVAAALVFEISDDNLAPFLVMASEVLCTTSPAFE